MERLEGFIPSDSIASLDTMAIEKMAITKNDRVLVVDSGPWAFGCRLCEYAGSVVELCTKGFAKKIEEKLMPPTVTNNTIIVGSEKRMPFKNEEFDLVVCKMALHHFKNMKKALKECARVLKKTGRMLIIDSIGPDTNRSEFNKLERLRDRRHIDCVTANELEKLISVSGLKINYSERAYAHIKAHTWATMAKANDKNVTKIMDALLDDIIENKKTGYEPFMLQKDIYFDYKFMLMLVGRA